MPILIPIIVAAIGGLAGIISTAIDNDARKYETDARKYETDAITLRLKLVIRFIAVGLIIASIGTGGVFLVKKLFFSKPSTVTEIVAVVEAVPEVVSEPEATEQELQTETTSESEPVAKTGFFHKLGEFFAGIGRAIKWFFITIGNAIKTFFVNVGAFFAGIFGKLISFVKGLFSKSGG
jgi:H+/Cl- antiporter ClcA